ncbi:hypothetical protein B0H16DRAFT_1614157, partial [Mycena metata]
MASLSRQTIVCPLLIWRRMSFDTALPCPFLNSGHFGLSGFSAPTLQPRVLGDFRLQRHYYSTRLQERPEGNAARTKREQVWDMKNWRLNDFKFLLGPETELHWLLWGTS